MDNHVFTLAQISSGRIFRIPDYQRGYSWEKLNCEELMEDLELLPTNFHHYTGTIVLKPTKNTEQDIEGNTLQVVDVVDGQQRLTTLTILLHCISESLKKFPAYTTLAKGIIKNYLLTTRLVDQQILYRLSLNRDSRTFFQSHILGNKDDLSGPQILSHKRLMDAKAFFVSYLIKKEETLKSNYPDWLISMFNKITNQLKLSLYLVEATSEVGVIFEVMNNRGKDLTELEKVKNYLLYLTSKLEIATTPELEEKINHGWRDLLEELMKAELVSKVAEDGLLQTHWLIFYSPDKASFSGSKTIKEKLSLKKYHGNHKGLYTEIERFVSTLKNCAVAYADYENPGRNGTFNNIENLNERREVIDLSLKLKRLGTATFRAMMVACRMVHPGQPQPYLTLLSLAERYAFRMFKIENRRADTGQNTLIKAAYELNQGTKDIDHCVFEMKKYLSWYSNKKAFETFWNYDPQNNDWYYWGGLKYLLYEYEVHLAKINKGHVQFAWDKFDKQDTIEHILPQTPERDYWKKQFSKKERQFHTHDLGNLVLTLNNSVYSNKEFSDKKGAPGDNKPCYANSSLYQERELASYTDWNLNNMQSRRAKLVEWAKQRWFVDLSEFEEQEIEYVAIEEEEIEN